MHWALNTIALACIGALTGALQSAWRWLLVTLVSALAVGSGLWWGKPQVGWCVGLSGVSHGLAAAGAVELLRHGRSAGWLWCALLTVKLGWEHWQGAFTGTQTLLGGATVIDAHLYRAAEGLAAALGLAFVPAPRQVG